MIVELITVFALLLGGCAFVLAAGLRGWAVAPLGLLTGVAVQGTIGFAQVITGVPTYPAITLALTVLLPVAWLVRRWRRGDAVSVSLPWAAAAAAGTAAGVVIFRLADLAKWHTDSLTYMIASDLLAHNTYRTGISIHFMTGRVLGLPVLHASANADNEAYLRSIMPLLAFATLGALVWIFHTGLRSRVPGNVLALIGGLGLVLLITNNRFVWNVFYINGHLMMAAQTMIIAGCGWLLVRRIGDPRTLQALQLIMIPALVIIRPEGSLAAALVLLPTLLTRDIAARHRMALLATLGVSTVGWQAYQSWTYLDRGLSVPFSVLGMLVLGVAMIAGAPILRWTFLTGRARELLWAVEAGLWLALIALSVRNPKVLVDSLRGTYANLIEGAGGWGLSLVVLGPLVVAALILFRTPHQAYLRFAVTTFVPMAFVLAFLREGAYRAGFGDSLTRMFMHVLPLAVLCLIVAVASHAAVSRRDGDAADASAGPGPDDSRPYDPTNKNGHQPELVPVHVPKHAIR
jgi:hypothetical protein